MSDSNCVLGKHGIKEEYDGKVPSAKLLYKLPIVSELISKEYRNTFQFLVPSHHSNIPYGEQRPSATSVPGAALEKTKLEKFTLSQTNANSLNFV